MKLTHPDSKQSIEVDDDHAENFKTQGWVEKPEPKSDPKGK
jgi:hypothetical protein